MRIEDCTGLCFSGGGSRGVSYVGVLCELARAGLDFHSVDRSIRVVVGSSIGALTAMLVVAGMTPEEMVRYTEQHDTSAMLHVEVSRVFSNWGLDSGHKLLAWIGQLLEQKMGRADVTLAQLHAQTGTELVVVVTNLNTNEPEYWSHVTAPDTPVAEAVATSMAMPLMFAPRRRVRVKEVLGDVPIQRCFVPARSSESGGTAAIQTGDVVLVDGVTSGRVARLRCAADGDVRVTVHVEETTLYCDGGFRDNFAMDHSSLDPDKTIGVKLQWRNAFDLSSIDRYCSRLAYCCLSSAEDAAWEKLSPCQRDHTIIVDVGDIATLDFHLPQSAVRSLVESGRDAAIQFLGGASNRSRTVATQTGNTDGETQVVNESDNKSEEKNILP